MECEPMDQCSDISSTSGIGGEEVLPLVDPDPQEKIISLNKVMQPIDIEEVIRSMLPPKKDDVNVKVTPTTATTIRAPPALLALKPKEREKKLETCEIPKCSKKVEKLTYATAGVLAYYGFKNKFAIVKVCCGCLKRAKDYEKNAVNSIRKKESIFVWKHEPQPDVETIDLDDDDTPGPDSSRRGLTNDEVKVDFEREDVAGIVHQMFKKHAVHKQIEESKQIATEEAEDLKKEFSGLNNMMNSIDEMLQNTCVRYNKFFCRPTKSMVVQEVEINADGTMRRRNLKGDDRIFINSESMNKLSELMMAQQVKNESEAEGKDANIVDGTADSRKPGPASKTSYYEKLEAKAKSLGPFQKAVKRPPELMNKRTMSLLPAPPVIPRVTPKVGDIVYAMYMSFLNCWLKAEVLEMLKSSDTNQTSFVIHYEPSIQGVPTGGKEGDGAKRIMRELTLKELAYNVPCPFVLPVGTRVIAKFSEESRTDPESDGYFYAGVVAEIPKSSNRNRYLIFFDDGYAQYVESEEILLVCESSKDVWNDVHPDSVDFIKEYIIRYPDWPLVRLFEDSIVPCEWNGKWWNARVKQVDSSLVQVRFEHDGREEWIYRGSSRLRPIYRQFKKEQIRRMQNAQSNTTPIPRRDKDMLLDRDNLTVEYNYDEKTGVSSTSQKVAKKSTGGRYPYHKMFDGKTHINMLDIDAGIEFLGDMHQIKIPDDCPKPKLLVDHKCNPDCVIDYVPTPEMKRRSPLAIPLFLGWEREYGGPKSGLKRFVSYRTPCGVRVKTYEDLSDYLEVTNSNLSMDMFSLDAQVDPLREFKPSRVLNTMKDISYGKEAVPIQCVNQVDYDVLPFMDYTPTRIPGPGVNINAEETDFLVCCDCTDNCQDKSKCACWKLTQEGISFTKMNNANVPTEGYVNQRLPQHIVSGIYECNSRCKCKQTCSNRVVQNGVRWPLQIFKTTKKGWGIRTLYDMPEGSFISIYAGEILTDQSANEEGIENGDEYFAELDYIECTERVKADYESDVTDIEEEDEEEDEDDSEAEAKRMRLLSSDSESESGGSQDQPKAKRPVRKTDGRKKDLNSMLLSDDEMVTARTPSHFSAKITSKKKGKKKVSLRDFFGSETEACFIMDAKKKGNIGRYLNHSCTPNVIVQNVFVDTHDLRFPMVAFFTNAVVRAGTELTWDYHYEIGTVPGKEMYCFCMTPYCRGRLL